MWFSRLTNLRTSGPHQWHQLNHRRAFAREIEMYGKKREGKALRGKGAGRG